MMMSQIGMMMQHFRPVRLLQTELSQPITPVTAIDAETGKHYTRALSLVRLHTQPLGMVALDLGDHGLSAAEYARRIWQELGPSIQQHLRQDGVADVAPLTVAGLVDANTPPCLEDYQSRLTAVPSASIVICTRDRPDGLATCLRSLACLDYPNYEVIVVDNAPRTEATVPVVRAFCEAIPRLRYVKEDRPGLSWARNCGAALADGDVIAFTDDDVVVDRHWLSKLVLAFCSHTDVACVTGLVVPMALETEAQEWFEQFGGFGRGFQMRVFDMIENRPNSPVYPFSCGMIGSGNNMAFKAPILRSIGFFDPALGAGTASRGGEDLSAFFSVITAGHKIVYEPAALVHHLHRSSYKDLHQQMYGYGTGLTAYLAKCLLDNPKRLSTFSTKMPYALVHLLSAHSEKNAKKSLHYPKELTRIERKGMLYGPFAYIRGLKQVKQYSHR
jgi:GT2 family glycosyltransferase